MKILPTLLLSLTVLAASAQIATINRVVDFSPAPGQFTNKLPAYEVGDSKETMRQKAEKALITNNSFVTLGGFGGSITVGFDHPVVNIKGQYDLAINGNAMPNSSEPGVIRVSKDVNANGKADDPWYEIKGAVHDSSATIANYKITYKYTDSTTEPVTWTDNQGGSGSIARQSAHKQCYFPSWLTKDMTFTGTRLPDNAKNTATPPATMYQLQTYAWGYADNHRNNTPGSYINIDWAVDNKGKRAELDQIDFVQIYTGVNQAAGWLGEVSTEVGMVTDLHPRMAPNAQAPTINKSHLVGDFNALTLANNSYWNGNKTGEIDINGAIVSKIALEGITLDNHYTPEYGSWSGFAYSNMTHNSEGGFANQYSAITGKGKVGDTYAIGYYNNFGSPAYISATDGQAHIFEGVYVTNNCYTYYAMLQGDDFSKRFGGADGTDPDYLLIKAIGCDEQGNELGSQSVYLADFRSDNSFEDYIVSQWKWLDLSALGKVNKIKFVMESSDNGQWGMNTPAYFCLDQPIIGKENPVIKQEPQLSGDNYSILNLNGKLTQPNSYWAGDRLGTDDSGIYRSNISSNDFLLSNSYWPDYMSWWGYGYSNINNTTDGSMDNQYAAITGSGVQGDTYGIFYASDFMGHEFISMVDNQSFDPIGLYITNSTWAYQEMKNGSSLCKKFGGITGADKDWLIVTAIGYNADNQIIGKTDYFLADFRSEAKDDYIANQWKWFDLSTLGEVSKIRFTINSSDANSYGALTPTYLAFDKLIAQKSLLSSNHAIEEDQSIMLFNRDNTIYIEAPIGSQIQIFNTSGVKIEQYQQADTTSSFSPNQRGIYLIKITVAGKTKTLKAIL